MNFIQRKRNQQPDKNPAEGDDDEPAKPIEKPKAKEEKPDYKFGIASRLDDAVDSRQRHGDSKRSPDLVELSKKFDGMRKSVRQMIVSARNYQSSLETMDKARFQFASELTAFAAGSPINKHVGSKQVKKSFLSVYRTASEDAELHREKFQTRILDYCDEWETVISARVDRETEDVKKLRTTYNKYQTKVDALRKKTNAQQAKGQPVNEAVAEKLSRNEEKLDEASATFEAAAKPLCLLIEEVVDHSWKDVLPMIQATMRWELQRSQNEAEVFGMWQPKNLEEAAPGLNKYKPISSPEKSSKKSKSKSNAMPEIPVDN